MSLMCIVLKNYSGKIMIVWLLVFLFVMVIII